MQHLNGFIRIIAMEGTVDTSVLGNIGIYLWRRSHMFDKELQFHWNDLHITTVNYFSNFYETCDFRKLPSAELLLQDHRWSDFDPQAVASFNEGLKQMFVVPKFQENQNRIDKCQLLQDFLSFLLHLLCNKTDPSDNRADNLEKEVRCLLTVVVDLSWTLSDRDEHQAQFQHIVADFETVADRAGCLVHYLLFSTDPNSQVVDEGIAALLNHAHLLKATLESSDVIIPAYTAPRTSAVNSILIVGSLLDDLQDLLSREGNPIADMRDQINLLHEGLLLLHSSISEMRLPQSSGIGELKVPLMRIGDISRQAEFLITAYLVEDAPVRYITSRLTYLNHQVEHISVEIQLITQKYKFGGLKVTKHFSPSQGERKNETKDVVVGFEEIARDILDQLVGGGTKSLQVISILGMPGLGKTTLAKKLYNHPLVNYTFDKLSWCVISQSYERRRILADILIHINSELGKDRILNMEGETLLELIYKTLKGRRYLVVMDDIWDSNVWYELQRCFPDDVNGSRILLTSRIKDVAPPNSIIHELPFFSDEQCWELLEKKVFGSGTCPVKLQQIGKKIAAKCCGLPLTVVVVAGILSTVDEEESRWEELGGSLASYIDSEENSVMQILELSYKHLPDHLKPCFLHFGAYDEDREISVGELKRCWISEGYIRREKEKSVENVAEGYIMELINRSLAIVAKRRSNGSGVKTCIVHDLLRDLCLKKCKEESFLKILNDENYTIFENRHCVRALGDSSTLSLFQHVRSFYDGHLWRSSLYVGGNRLLRVLHFSKIEHDSCLFGIEHLVNLRFLVINEMPSWIEKLQNLEYLSVLCSVCLPPVIVKMEKLRYFHAVEAEYGEDWSSCQTNSLEYLSRVNIARLRDEELLKCSPNLRKLRCMYDNMIYLSLEENEYPFYDLCFLTQLDSLNIAFYHTHYGFKLEEFGFPSNIRKLTLSFSKWSWEKMSVIPNLENLEVLKLRSVEFEDQRWDTRDGEFQQLRFLQLEEVYYIYHWNVASSEHFPKLQHLILRDCIFLQEIPSEIGEITTLESIEVKGQCLYTLRESAERIKEEQRDMGNEDLRVIIN